MSDILMVFCAGSVGGLISTILTLAWVSATIQKIASSLEEAKKTKEGAVDGQVSQS